MDPHIRIPPQRWIFIGRMECEKEGRSHGCPQACHRRTNACKRNHVRFEGEWRAISHFYTHMAGVTLSKFPSVIAYVLSIALGLLLLRAIYQFMQLRKNAEELANELLEGQEEQHMR